MSSYYERSNVTHLDGSRIFHTPTDTDAEQSVAAELERAWGCELHKFGALAAVDWYATRHGRMVGLLELKNRSHASDSYETVFLNVRKWMALTLSSVGLGAPPIFVVRFTDGIRWVPVAEIDASHHRIAGCSRIVKASNDIEPVIEVPVLLLRRLPGVAP